MGGYCAIAGWTIGHPYRQVDKLNKILFGHRVFIYFEG